MSRRNFSSYTAVDIIDLNHQAMDFNILINQAWLFADNQEVEAMSCDFPELSIIKWGKYGADIIPKDCSKGKGVQEIISRMGYDKRHTYAFGDADNDVEMFQMVGMSVVMKNGSEAAKKHAHYFAESIENDGLAQAIIALGLTQRK